MGKKLYITAIVWSAFLLLIVSSIPHHHHDGAWCVTVERCAEDQTDNDPHTGHAGDRSSCLENERFLPVENESDSLLPVVIRLSGGVVADLFVATAAAEDGQSIRILAHRQERDRIHLAEGMGGDHIRRGPPMCQGRSV